MSLEIIFHRRRSDCVHIFTAINIVNITGAIATFGTALYTSVQLGTNLKKIGKKEV